ncbi:Hypothetical Protein FCC1311_094792 [Hondaea fermentalgiana]|uniref:Uncharacterized protein n=1 Tax=Hondaea fermentalgiana TaxID=2315210 RepID=A0A2R5GRM7_9STRA|nr:Hypothetical Protein FCC1311_094792 [Hondaea fermentalgiana]|eukprot:GBG33255.1 Hypothetical Protein FCC1311_094792 [Hondaea fermentalgiana]
MDSFLNVFKRLTHSTSYDKWQPSFTKLVQQVCARQGGSGRSGQGLAVHERIAILRKLDPFIRQSRFVNSDENEMLQAKRDLLMLWEYLLEFVVVISKTSVKDLGYSLIVQLMQREEFALENLGFGPNSAAPRCSPAHLRLAEKYKTLLVQTYMLVMKSMTNKGKYAEIIHFSAQTLVVFFFRLPLVGGSIVDALERKAAMQREGKDPDELRLFQPFSPDASSTKHEIGIEDTGKVVMDGGNDNSDAAAAKQAQVEDKAQDGENEEEENTKDEEDKGDELLKNFCHNVSEGERQGALAGADSEAAAQMDAIMRSKQKRAALAAAAAAAEETSTGVFIMSNPDLYMWNYFNSEEEARALTRVLTTDNACLSWLATKETFFLTFVEMYVVHVESVATHPITWEVVPAYHLVLDCFWPLLRSSMWWDGICKRRVGDGDGWVTSLPAYMRVKRSALALLSNKALINPFIKLTFMCTNAHSLLSVDSCVEHLNLWFSTVAYAGSAREGISNHNQNSRNTPPKQRILDDNVKDASPTTARAAAMANIPRLPESFDYPTYWFGIGKLLESDLFQVLLKVLSLLYNTFHLFRGQLRVKFVNDLMSSCFFALFLHWSSEVRTYFHLTLVYKVLRADRRNLPCFTDALVIESYGESQEACSPLRALSQKRFAFGEPSRDGESAAVPPAVYSGQSSHERRMAAFDDSSVTDNEELLIDIMSCSKIDSYVRMCLEKDPSIPEARRSYVDASLRQYAGLLKQYYMGVSSDSSESLPLLAHRMVYSDSNPYM